MRHLHASNLPETQSKKPAISIPKTSRNITLWQPRRCETSTRAWSCQRREGTHMPITSSSVCVGGMMLMLA